MDEKRGIIMEGGRVEREILEQSVSTLLNKQNGVLVVGSKLISSIVDEVESKSL